MAARAPATCTSSAQPSGCAHGKNLAPNRATSKGKEGCDEKPSHTTSLTRRKQNDVERLKQGGAVTSDWHQLPNQGIVNKTPFVILVRKGNPKGIKDFPDLARPGVKLIHPDPVSSGGAQWSVLAIYGSELVKSEKQTGARDETRVTSDSLNDANKEFAQIKSPFYVKILANIFVTFPLAFGVIKPVFDTMSRSLEEASATIGATRWQTFRHVTLPSLRGAIVTGALLTFARAVGEFGSTILVSGNPVLRTQTAPLYIFAKFNE